MATIIHAGFRGTIFPHLTGRPGLVGRDIQKPANTRVRVRLPKYQGAKLWAVLHQRTLAWAGGEDGEWLGRFRGSIPCGECRAHWDEMMARTPPDWASYFGWSVARHNEVNQRLGKPEISEAEALAIWGAARID